MAAVALCAAADRHSGSYWTGGILALAGIELDLFAAFAVVTLLGIGVDYGVHLVHRYQERGDAAAATAELAPVILVAAAITILGYGTLVTSSYPPLRSIGLVSVVSVVALAAASVLVLPALLLPRLLTQGADEVRDAQQHVGEGRAGGHVADLRLKPVAREALLPLGRRSEVERLAPGSECQRLQTISPPDGGEAPSCRRIGFANEHQSAGLERRGHRCQQ